MDYKYTTETIVHTNSVDFSYDVKVYMPNKVQNTSGNMILN